MASIQDLSAARPLSQHRLSIPSSQPANIPVRQSSSSSRHHSHSVSLGAMKDTNRITRRKSMSSNAASNAAAVAAALREAGEVPSTSLASHRRSLPTKKASHTPSISGPSGLGSDVVGTAAEDPGVIRSKDANATVDGHSDKPTTKNRNRRASEGAHLFKGEGKRVSGEMRCDTCGKGYKHSSCLTKHMWEHDPAWAVTSKFLISKHQQVQLLEAASVLVNMNLDSTPPETPRVAESDGSSASPAASGSSEMHDGLSSAETTPPPMGEDHGYMISPRFGNPKRQSSSSSVFSRSYQSAPSNQYLAGSAPSPSFSHYRNPSGDSRPTTSGTGIVGKSMSDDDEAGLAAAVELCNFGTPRSGPVHLPANIPPVPPLPARFLSPNANQMSGAASTPTVYNPLTMHPPLIPKMYDEREVKMEEYDRNNYEEADFPRRHAHADDDDDGVFGRMEE